VLCAYGAAVAQPAVDMGALIRETQKLGSESQRVTLVWWLPEQFWQASMKQDKRVTEQQAEQFLAVIRPYTMIALVDGRVGPMGGITYRSEEDIRRNVSLRDAAGRVYEPFGEAGISPDAKNPMQVLRPVIANIIGPMGQNTHFILFGAKSAQGESIADATRPGSFQVVYENNPFSFRLPLGSILPPKFDPATRERFPGNYDYNPYTGARLIAQ